MASKVSRLFSLGFLTLASTALSGTDREITATNDTQNAIQIILESESVSDSDVLVFSSESPYIFSGQVSTDFNLALRGESVTLGQPPATILQKTTESRFFKFCTNCGGNESGIENLQFIDESELVTSDDGGAVYVEWDLLGGIKSSTFSGNHASGYGGAVYAGNFSGSIESSTFSENHANGNGDEIYGDGGAVSVWNCFNGNIGSSFFLGNYGSGYGGAMCVSDFTGSVENSTFSGNYAGGHGGAIFAWSYFSGSIASSFFSGNHADGDADADGGAVYAWNFNGTVESSNFSENYANNCGGAVLICESFIGNIESSFFSENNAGKNGGALWVCTFDGNIESSFFFENYAIKYGGAMYVENFRGNIESSTFSENHANDSGGAIYVSESDFIGNIESSSFSGNYSTNYGGAVYVHEHDFNGDIEGSDFSGNHSSLFGGAVCASNLNGNIESSNFSGNYINYDGESNYGYGGALCIFSGFSGIIEDSVFSGNHCSACGGAMYAGNFTGTIESSTFFENYCGAYGGAVYISNFEGNIESSIFSKNNAYYGGAVYVGSKFNGNIESSTFFENHGSNCCAVYAGEFIGSIKDSIFFGNFADETDGAVFVGHIGGITESFCDLGGSKFLSNSSIGGGGAIAVAYNCYLGALSGDVIFQGNNVSAKPNAIIHRNNSGNGILSLAAVDGRTFYLYDPISSHSVRRQLTIGINPESGHGGTVLLDRHHSDVYFESQPGATVSHGTLALHNGAGFGGETNSGTFTLQSDAILRVAYDRETRVFDCESGESDSYTISESAYIPTYDSESGVSRIFAGKVNLGGRVDFFLPENVKSGNSLLIIPGLVEFQSVTFSVGMLKNSAEIDVGDSIVLIHSDEEIVDCTNYTHEPLLLDDEFLELGYYLKLSTASTNELLLTLCCDNPTPNGSYPESLTESMPESVPESVSESMMESATESFTESIPESAIWSESYYGESMSESMTESLTESVPESSVWSESYYSESMSESVPESVPESAVWSESYYGESIPESVPESVSESMTESVPESAIWSESYFSESMSESVLESATESFTESIPESTIWSESYYSESMPESMTESVPESSVWSESYYGESMPESVPESVPESTIWSESYYSESMSESVSESMTESMTESVPESTIWSESYYGESSESMPKSVPESSVWSESYCSESMSESMAESVLESAVWSESYCSESMSESVVWSESYFGESSESVSESMAESVPESAVWSESYYSESMTESMTESLTESAPESTIWSESYYGESSESMPESVTESVPESAVWSESYYGESSESISESVTESVPESANLTESDFGSESDGDVDSEVVPESVIAPVLETPAAAPEGYPTGIILLNRCGDLIGDFGETILLKPFNLYGVVHCGVERHQISFPLEVGFRSLLAGFNVCGDTAHGRWSGGAFLESGFASFNRVRGAGEDSYAEGRCNSLGCGVLLRGLLKFDDRNHFSVEASGRAGRIENRWSSDNLLSFSGARMVCEAASPYGGAHGGVGYRMSGSKLTIDLYGKYFWTGLAGKSLQLENGTAVEFQEIYSSRARIGGRISLPSVGRLCPYGGAAWEREFLGKGDVLSDGALTALLSLRGNSAMGELGFRFQFNDGAKTFSFDGGLRAYYGARRGARATLHAACEF